MATNRAQTKNARAKKKVVNRIPRAKRLAVMAKEILDVDGAAELLGVSNWTIYELARRGTIPATRVGREWRFGRQTLIQWVANGSQTDQLEALLSNARPVRRR